MTRYSISFSTIPAQPHDGNMHVTLYMQTWEDKANPSTEVILETRLYDVEAFDGKDKLVWAEHVCDAIYKAINVTRARQMDTGWISGSMSSDAEASENPSLGM